MSDFLLLPLLGGIWTLVSIIVIRAREAGVHPVVFYFAGTTVSTVLCCLASFLPGMAPVDFSLPGTLPVLGCFAAASLLNASGQAVTMYNLKSGGRALAVAIPQLSFLFPFFCTMLFWGEPADFRRILGVAVITLAVFLSSYGSPRNDVPGQWNLKRLGFSLITVVLAGMSQTTVVMSSYLYGSPVSGMLKTFVYIVTAALFFGILTLFEIRRTGFPALRKLKFGGLWGIVATVSNLLLFYCVELFTRQGRSGIVYAVACASLMVFIMIYTRFRLKEKLTFLQNLAALGMIAGVLMVRLGGGN
ncbi:MAG: hypothetical protein IJT50_02785 [Lentisphaeria bacterium]|nr:hypothetical protein [Lentisphaeria bacterium]